MQSLRLRALLAGLALAVVLYVLWFFLTVWAARLALRWEEPAWFTAPSAEPQLNVGQP